MRRSKWGTADVSLEADACCSYRGDNNPLNVLPVVEDLRFFFLYNFFIALRLNKYIGEFANDMVRSGSLWLGGIAFAEIAFSFPLQLKKHV